MVLSTFQSPTPSVNVVFKVQLLPGFKYKYINSRRSQHIFLFHNEILKSVWVLRDRLESRKRRLVLITLWFWTEWRIFKWDLELQDDANQGHILVIKISGFHSDDVDYVFNLKLCSSVNLCTCLQKVSGHLCKILVQISITVDDCLQLCVFVFWLWLQTY